MRRKVFFMQAIILCFSFSLFAAEIAQKDNSASWDRWINSIPVTEYFQKSAAITIEMRQKGLIIQQKLKGRSNFEEIVSELKELGFESQKKMKELHPPEELRTCHQKMTESLEYGTLASIAMIKKDEEKATQYTRQTYEASIGGDEERRRVYSEHGAPNEVLIEIDRRIEQGKEEMKRHGL